MKKLTIIILILMFSLACATPYQKLGSAGGYSDFKVSDRMFFVNFEGNAATSTERIAKFALRRAAEVTLENGYSHFAIVSAKDTSKVTGGGVVSGMVMPGTNPSMFAGVAPGPSTKPEISFFIRCFKEAEVEEGMDAVDAKEFLEANFKDKE